MATNVRTVEVRLEVTGEGQFKSQMGQAADAVKGVGTQAKTAEAHASGTVSVLGRMGTVAKTAIGSFIGFGSAQAAMMATAEAAKLVREEILGVNDSVAQAAAVFGNVSGKQRDDMVRMAHDLGVEWGMSSAEIAKGFRSLADEGFTAEQAIGALPQLVAFARAGMIDLATATHDVVGVMYSFGLVSNDAAKNTANVVHVTDMLTAAADASHATIEGLSEGLAKVAPISKSLGIPVHEVIALMSELSDVGFSGRRAMFAFTALFTEMPKHAAALHAAGIEIYNSAGQLRPVGEIIGALQEKFRGLSAQQIQAQLTAVGFTGATAKTVLALISAGDGFDQLDRKIQDSAGTTQSVASKAMESLTLRLAQVREAAIRLAIDGFEKMAEFAAFIGQEFAPAFEKLGSVAQATAHFLQPIAQVLGGTAFVTGKIAIEGVATALDKTSGFLEHNQKLVEILVILYGVKLVGALIATAVAEAQVIAFDIAQWAFAGAMALTTLITNFELTRSAALAAGESFATMRAGWAVFGTPIVIGAFTVALFGLVKAYQDADSAGKQWAANFVKNLHIDPTSQTSMLSGIKAVEAELDNLHAKANDQISTLGFAKTLVDTLGGVVGFKPFKSDDAFTLFGQVHHLTDDQLKNLENDYKHLWGEIGTGAAYTGKVAQGELAKAFEQSDAGRKWAQQLKEGFTQVQLAEAGTPSEQYTTHLQHMLDIAKAAGIDLSTNFAPAVAALSDKLDGVTPAGQAAALAITAVGNASTIGVDQADAFAKALTAISDAAFGTDDALRASHTAILDLIDARNAADKKGVHFGDDMTREGIAFSDAAEKVITSYQGILVAMVKHGAKAKEVQNATAYLEASFRQQASALGIPQAAIDHFVSGLHLSADQLRTLKLNVNVDVSQVPHAVSQLDSLKTRVREAQAQLDALVHRSGVIHVDPREIVEARRRVQDLNALLTVLSTHPGLLKVDHSDVDLAVQKLQDAKHKRDDLVDAPGHPDPLKLHQANAAIDTAKTKLQEAIAKAQKLGDTQIKPKAAIDTTAFDASAQHIDTTIARWNATTIRFPIGPTGPSSGPLGIGANQLQFRGMPGPHLGSLYGGIYESHTSSSATVDRYLERHVELPRIVQYIDGGVEPRTVTAAADGFMQSSAPIAQIAPAGAWRVWAEPETGGEAYIPLAPSKRERSTTILSTVASMFGLDVAPRRFADGGVSSRPRDHAYGLTRDPHRATEDDPARREYSPRQLAQYADLQLARLHVSFGPLGLHTPRLEWVSDRRMRDEYKGVTIYGPSPDAIANGDASTGKIQLNRDLLTTAPQPLAYTRVAVAKEWAQTVLPHFLDTDRKIRRYFDIIGYRPKTDAHLVDDLWSGQATVAGNTTTPADLFGYFAAHLIGGHTASPGGFDFAAYGAIAERLRKSGLIPGQIKADPVITFLARLIHATGDSPLENAIRQLAKLPDTPAPPASSTSTEVLATRPDGSGSGSDGSEPTFLIPLGNTRVYADGGIEQYDDGGEVPGPAGTPRLAVVHGGERVLTEHENRAYAAGGINYVRSDIGVEGNRQTQVPEIASRMAGSPIFRNAAAAAVAGITDPKQRQDAINQALEQTAQLYYDVSKAAGRAAAEQLAASGLVGQSLADAGAKIIQDAQARRQARAQYAAEVKSTRRQLQDDEYADGQLSFARYVRLLHERLRETKKYSADWLAIHEQIRSAQQSEDQKDQTKQAAKQAAQQTRQSGFDKYAGPQEQATSLTGAFGSAKTVTAAEVEGFLKNVLEGVKQFRDVIRTLVAKGYPHQVVQQIAEQGPVALPLAKALLQVPVKEVVGDYAQIDAIIRTTSSSDLRSFGTTEIAQIPAPKTSGPALESTGEARHGFAIAHRAYDRAVAKYTADVRHHAPRAQIARDRAEIRRARDRVHETEHDVSRSTVWAAAVPDAEPERPPEVAPPGEGLPGFVSTARATSSSSSGPAAPTTSGAQLVSTMPAVRAVADQSVRVTFADGSIKLDLRGAASKATSMAELARLVKAGVGSELDKTFARMDRDIRSRSQSPKGR